ncbi:hypothetical protein LCGC14_1703230 [marine sediment metagenome]|uniref:Uncharacterized protein n=1 Tax=marine sediment metagenome TaxID=412755 RepID=A0A0F9JXU9_9ZZZZ
MPSTPNMQTQSFINEILKILDATANQSQCAELRLVQERLLVQGRQQSSAAMKLEILRGINKINSDDVAEAIE